MDRRTFLAETLAGAAGCFFPVENLLADVPLRSEHLIARADRINGNKRIYPKALLERVVADFKAMPPRSLMGELGQKEDSIIHFANVSHMIVDLKLSDFGPQLGHHLIAEIELLATPCGTILKKLMQSPGTVAFRTCGVGSGRVNEDGVLVIGDSYKMITINALPAKEAAFV